MTDFCARLTTALNASPEYRGNKRKLSLDVGKGDRYVSNLLNSPHQNTEPGLFTARKMAECLGVSIEYLCGQSDELTVSGKTVPKGAINRLSNALLEQITSEAKKVLDVRHERPSIEAMVRWWYSTGGRLENYDAIADSIDLHHRPNLADATLKLGTIGARSLAATALGSDDPDVLRRSLETLTGDRMARIITDYAQVQGAKFAVTLEQVTVVHPITSRRIELTYQRLLMPVTDDKGRDMVANYSKLL